MKELLLSFTGIISHLFILPMLGALLLSRVPLLRDLAFN